MKLRIKLIIISSILLVILSSYLKNNYNLLNTTNIDNNTEKMADKLIVLYYDSINEDNIKSTLEKLNKNNFYSITLNDYLKWKKDNIKLKEKAILIFIDKNIDSKVFKDNNYNYIEISNINNIELSNNYKPINKGENSNLISNYLITDKNFDKVIQKALNYEEYKITENINYGSSFATYIPVLNYHFFYDPNKGETCYEEICLSKNNFEEQLKYLKDNSYKTLTIDEFKNWMYGKIEPPEKSVLITIDDGAMGTGTNNGNILIPLLEKYQLHATLFLISGWWDPKYYQSEYLDIQSHTSNMHREGLCNNETRGSQLLCSSYEEILKDLDDSIKDVGSNTAFCYPYYAYNEKILKALKEKEFKIAFIGGGYKASRYNDKYKIPRYVITNNISLEEFISYIN